MSNLKVLIEGAAKDGNFDLGVLVGALQSLRGALRGIDRDLHGRKTSEFLVVDMSRDSPHALSLAQLPVDTPSHGGDIFSVLLLGLNRLEHGDFPEVFGEATLESLKGFGAAVGKKLRSLELRTEDESVFFDESVRNRIDALLAPREYCHTEVEGVLEQINIHANANLFFIYPDIGPRRVKCHFNDELRYEAMGGLGRKVVVRGEAAYRRDYPFEIYVSEMEIFPPDDELPTFEDVRGLAKDAYPNDRRSEDIIAELRDEWA